MLEMMKKLRLIAFFFAAWSITSFPRPSFFATTSAHLHIECLHAHQPPTNISELRRYLFRLAYRLREHCRLCADTELCCGRAQSRCGRLQGWPIHRRH